MAQEVEGNHPTLLIDGDGNFNSKFEDDLKLAAVSRPVAVVSVFGVQSTGKSTLMNSLLSTGFEVMDASQGMHQTTKGIWVAKYPLPNPNGGHEILAVDTEGSDGIEREDDTKFEKQTALFCLAVSNTVIVNMKCDTVNHNNGGNRPLLRTVVEVMITKFCTPRKVNLVFVLRDKNECPRDKLEEQLKEGMYKIWKEMKKPEAQLNASLKDFFNSWLQIEKNAISVQGFGARVSAIIGIYLSQYDEEAQHYDETKRDASRKQLIEDIMKVVKPTYLSVVEHMRHEILEKFEQAAVDELKKNGVLVAMNTDKYINRFKNQLKDAAVKQANWNQDAGQLNQLQLVLDHAIKVIRDTNELLEQKKKDKRAFWFKVGSIGTGVLTAASAAGSLILAVALL
ncbi:protein ROOT HAIR DEFECTIVE 3-like isoform X4 [Coffea arabica]|uniref:Protein ROOT HAIR DEFECTIVE 3-like isoform X4 n=1 Tax=Coffea arabica TaxID=13443 RepID=A0A6P6WT82_COFAR|nr:protein ROOT HAIR DEFECTIVE 3-like [Coffea arabica]